MTLPEFKAWLDGFLDGKDGLTAEQVATVQAKVAMVHEPITPRLLDTYHPPVPRDLVPFWQSPVMCGGGTTAGLPDWLKSATLCNTEQ